MEDNLSEGYTAADYLSFKVLEKLVQAQRDGRAVTKTQFWKLPCIVDRHLEETTDEDVGLPRYWYQFGEVLNVNAVNSGLFVEQEDERWGGTRVEPSPGVSDDRFELDEETKEKLDGTIHEVVLKFANEDSETVKQYQYDEYAPNEFIRQFDVFRQKLNVEEHSTTLADFGEGGETPSEIAIKALDDVYDAYPEDLYDDGYPLFLRWEDTTRMILEKDDLESAKSLADSFWETFSKIELRLKHEKNTPEEQIARWVREKPELVSNFRSRLSNVREDVLTDNEKDGEDVLDSVSESYSDTVREML